MGWYSERIKGSNLQKHRHRLTLGATIVVAGLGVLTSFSPAFFRFRDDVREGHYQVSAWRQEQMAAFRLGGAVPTRAQKEELIQDAIDVGMEDMMPVRSAAPPA